MLEEFNAEGTIEEVGREDYMPCQSIDLFAAGADNPYAPIAFVYRRSVHERIGLFDERFSVVGDWDFNLRFLQVFEVGVIDQRLANYHWRTPLGRIGLRQHRDGRAGRTRRKIHRTAQPLPAAGLAARAAGPGLPAQPREDPAWQFRLAVGGPPAAGSRRPTRFPRSTTRLRRWEWFFTRNSNLRAALQPGAPGAVPMLARAAKPLAPRLRLSAPRDSAEDLAARLADGDGSRCRVLSLDVFDTALLRWYATPRMLSCSWRHRSGGCWASRRCRSRT